MNQTRVGMAAGSFQSLGVDRGAAVRQWKKLIQRSVDMDYQPGARRSPDCMAECHATLSAASLVPSSPCKSPGGASLCCRPAPKSFAPSRLRAKSHASLDALARRREDAKLESGVAMVPSPRAHSHVETRRGTSSHGPVKPAKAKPDTRAGLRSCPKRSGASAVG